MTSTTSKPADLKVTPSPHGAPDTEPLARGDATHRPGEVVHDLAGQRGADSGGSQRSIGAKVVRGFFQLALPILVIVGGIAGYNYLKATRPEAPERVAKPTIYPVRAMTVTFTTVQPQLRLFGNTVAGRQVDIRSLVAGQVIAASDSLRDGGQLDKGAMIVTINPFDYRSQLAEIDAQIAEANARIKEFEASIAVEKSNLKFAREQAQLAATDLERARPLSRRGAVSERTVDDRRVILNTRRQAAAQSENNIKVLEARIAQQEAAITRWSTNRDRAQQRLDETKLAAPFNAYVADVSAQVGRMVGVNDKVATLIDRDRIDVAFNVTDQQFGRLVRGSEGVSEREVEIRWNVGEEPIVYQGRIDRVSANVASEAGGVQLYARVSQPANGVGLRPGAFVEVLIADTVFTKVARLPSTAIFDRTTVFAIHDGKLKSRKVKIVGTAGSDVLVRGELQAGEAILATRLSLPGDGVRVRIIDGDQAGTAAAVNGNPSSNSANAKPPARPGTRELAGRAADGQ